MSWVRVPSAPPVFRGRCCVFYASVLNCRTVEENSLVDVYSSIRVLGSARLLGNRPSAAHPTPGGRRGRFLPKKATNHQTSRAAPFYARPSRTCPRRRPFRRPRGPCGPTGALEFGVQTVRAHGGCLGGGRRRRTRQAAISPGETHAVFDPGVSEWGNPASSRMPPPREPNSAAGARPGEVKHLSSRRKRKKHRFRK